MRMVTNERQPGVRCTLDTRFFYEQKNKPRNQL
jgi:hypothetical protein